MGARGPAPKPTRIKELQGNPGKRALNKDEPRPPPGDALKCPPWLHRHAKAKWKELAPLLLELGLLTAIDGESFALACQAWADWRCAVETLNAEGQTVSVGSQIQPHPAAALAKAAWDRWKKASALFGLSPSDRVRVKAAPPAKEEVDPLQELLNRAHGTQN